MLPRFCAFKSNSVLLRFCFGYFSGKKQEFCTGLVKMATSSGPTMWHQSVVTIEPKKRGIHLITDQIAKIPELKKYKIGLANLCLQHTSASLSLNESWDPSVRVDMEMMLNRIAPENAPYTHTMEGPDDMPGIWVTCESFFLVFITY